MLDEGVLEALRALAPARSDVAGRVIALYLDSSEKYVTSIENALQHNNLMLIQRAAHTLKSSSRNVGATRLGSLCRDIEMRVREGELESVKLAVTALRGEYLRVRHALEHYRDASTDKAG